ncbi:NUDIX domain-containing protein [Bacillus salacetis]|uniref:NUDIX domain-containing protein n=1 Tax=Bacillus salacetis TaxID=2315464 RepID=A0A3A1R8L7_9BACI|nr:NUDIX domain-containing protein [Bacillus salacetis]RIW37290.1 NUDIX domain-containing protein [Bacillus salacetis]
MRNRGSVVIIRNEEAVLIKRVKNGEEYFVFPGGGIERGESPEQAAAREAYEELGVTVKISQCLSEIDYEGKQYFFAAKIITGKLGEGKAEEFRDSSRGTYELVWVPLEKFPEMDIRPAEAARTINLLPTCISNYEEIWT